MIRLRTLLEDGLRHPLLGPLLLLLLGLLLAFIVLHAIEDGLEGQLLTCVLLAAAVLRLVVVIGSLHRIRLDRRLAADRAPPCVGERRPQRASRPPTFLFSLPLRR